MYIFEAAIGCGYTHFDTSSDYFNESKLGQALKNKNRDKFTITSKTFLKQYGYKNTLNTVEHSLEKLKTDYIDNYLIHWPVSLLQNKNYKKLNIETFKALVDAKKQGKILHVGVSNFMPWHLRSLITLNLIPEINQIEFHIGINQNKVIDFCNNHNIKLTGYSSLMQGCILNNNIIKNIANKYNKSIAQICICYNLQNKIIPIVKTTNINHMKENLNIDFILDNNDLNVLKNISLNKLEKVDSIYD